MSTKESLTNTKYAETFTCDPCKFRVVESRSVKYCKTYQEALCKDCSDVHKSSKATRNHFLVGFTDITVSSKPGSALESLQNCYIHPAKQLEFFCAEHNHLICSTCILLDKSRNCKNVIEVARAGTAIMKSEFVDKVRADLKAITLKLEGDAKSIKLEKATSAKIQTDIEKRLRETRSKFISLFDKLENEIICEVKSETLLVNDRLNHLEKKVNEVLKTVKDINLVFEGVIQYGSESDIFRCILLIGKYFDECDSKTDVKKSTIDLCHISLKLSTALQLLLNENIQIMEHKKSQYKFSISKFPNLQTNFDEFLEISVGGQCIKTIEGNEDCCESVHSDESSTENSNFKKTKMDVKSKRKDIRITTSVMEDKHQTKHYPPIDNPCPQSNQSTTMEVVPLNLPTASTTTGRYLVSSNPAVSQQTGNINGPDGKLSEHVVKTENITTEVNLNSVTEHVTSNCDKENVEHVNIKPVEKGVNIDIFGDCLHAPFQRRKNATEHKDNIIHGARESKYLETRDEETGSILHEGGPCVEQSISKELRTLPESKERNDNKCIQKKQIRFEKNSSELTETQVRNELTSLLEHSEGYKQLIQFKITHESVFEVPLQDNKLSDVMSVLVLSDERTIICDYDNSRIILLDKKFQLQDKIDLSAKFDNAVTLKGQCLAICHKNKGKISLLEYTNTLNHVRHFDTQYRVKCVQSVDDTSMLVSMLDGIGKWHLHIISNTGHLIQKLNLNRTILDGYSLAVIFSADFRFGYRIIQCCEESDAVYCFEKDGRQIFKFKVHSPNCVVVHNTGYIFLLDNFDHIHVLSLLGQQLYKTKCCSDVTSIAICPEMNKLLLTRYKDRNITVLSVVLKSDKGALTAE